MPQTTVNPGVGSASQPATAGRVKRSNIEVLFIVKNEEMNLPYSLPAAVRFADKVWVVDSGSTDKTVEIAKAHGAEVVHQKWLGYAAQKNWALDNLPMQSDWVLIVDGDEVVLDDLRDAMMALSSKPIDQTPEAGFYVNRYFIFLGKRIRHCGFYPSWNLRFFKRGKARYEVRDVHEHMIVDGPVGHLPGHLEHNDRRGLEVYMDKHNKYATLEAREIFRVEMGQSAAEFKGKFFGNPVERRRWIKEHIYARLPFKFLGRFMYSYFLRLGVLDGMTGLRFCLFMSAYELLIELKLLELRIEHKEKAANVRG